MAKRNWWREAALAAILATGLAWAQQEPIEEPIYVEPGFERDQLRDELFGMELGVRGSAGLSVYTGDLADYLGLGPAWGVGVTLDRPGLWSWELTYNGARNPVDEDIVIGDAAVWRHGLTGMARLSPQLFENVTPYVGAGLGVAIVNPNEPAETVMRNDFVQELPFAAGIDVTTGRIRAGIRSSFSFLFGEEFANPLAANTEGSILSTSINVGGTF